MLSLIEFGRDTDGSMYWGTPPAGTGGTTADEAEVEKQIRDNDVLVFSSTGCPFCSEAISSLESAGYSPVVVQVGSAQKRVLADMCGSRSVPKVFVKGNFIGGCNDGGMGGVLPLLKNGKIAELLAQASDSSHMQDAAVQDILRDAAPQRERGELQVLAVNMARRARSRLVRHAAAARVEHIAGALVLDDCIDLELEVSAEEEDRDEMMEDFDQHSPSEAPGLEPDAPSEAEVVEGSGSSGREEQPEEVVLSELEDAPNDLQAVDEAAVSSDGDEAMILASPEFRAEFRAESEAISSGEDDDDEVAIVPPPQDDMGYVELVDEDQDGAHTPLLSEPDENDIEDWSPEPVSPSESQVSAEAREREAARSRSPRGRWGRRAAEEAVRAAIEEAVPLSPPEAEGAHFYVEHFRVESGSRVCDACREFLLPGHLAMGFTRPPPPSPLALGSPDPQWIHAPRCIRRANLAVRSTERVAFGPMVPERARECVLEELAAQQLRQVEPAWPGQTPVAPPPQAALPWRYSPEGDEAPWAVASVSDFSYQVPRPPPPPPQFPPPPPPPPRLVPPRLMPPAPPEPVRATLLSALARLAASAGVAHPTGLWNIGGEPEELTVPEGLEAAWPLPSLMQALAAQQRSREDMRAAQEPAAPQRLPSPPSIHHTIRAWAARRSREESDAAARLDAALASVPTQRLEKDEEEPCIICHVQMIAGEECRRLPCLHLFHTGCIDRWLRVKATCPLDNLKLEDMLTAQESIQSGGSWSSSPQAETEGA